MQNYDILYKQVELLVDKSLPLYTNLSNVSAVLNQMEDINWCGFYLVNGNTLYLGPFQGEVACTTIEYGKGVCGTSFKNKETIIVDDVSKFEGHIACSTKSKSEIVVPIIKNNVVKGVIDIDSPSLSRFTNKEKDFLTKVASILENLF